MDGAYLSLCELFWYPDKSHRLRWSSSRVLYAQGSSDITGEDVCPRMLSLGTMETLPGGDRTEERDHDCGTCCRVGI